MVDATDADRHFRETLTELQVAARANASRAQLILDRAAWLLGELESGRDLVELVESEDHPRTVELLTENLAALQDMGARFRAAQALALRDRGLTITAIAELFGVTPQRISALLRQSSATGDRISHRGAMAANK